MDPEEQPFPKLRQDKRQKVPVRAKRLAESCDDTGERCCRLLKVLKKSSMDFELCRDFGDRFLVDELLKSECGVKSVKKFQK